MPRDFGVRRLGHFEFLRPGVAPALWEEIASWLEARTAAAADPRQSTGIGHASTGIIPRDVTPDPAGIRTRVTIAS